MGYSQWVAEHGAKHKKIVEKLLARGFDKEQIIEYFDFDTMKKEERDFCPLYARDEKCHDMEELNCYLCSCPNFRYNDDGFEKREGKRLFSYCSIDSSDGEAGVYGDAIHQNCSGCTVPHHKSYVAKHFDLDWMKIMKQCGG